MSLYDFENSTTYHVIFTVFFLAMMVLLMLSVITIYRSQYIPEQAKKLNMVRYIVVWCLLLQFLTFFAYYIHYVPLFIIIWNLWVPSWTAGYVVLSNTIAILYSQQMITKRIADIDQTKPSIEWLILWGGCSLSEWIATICGFGFGFGKVQAIGYMLWKLIALIMLVLLIKMLYYGQKQIQNFVDPNDNFSKMRIDRGLTKIKHLMIVEVVLALYLFISVAYEAGVIVSVFNGHLVTSVYVTQATIMKMVVYFPLWSLINTVLLVYGWIPRRMMIIPNESQMKENKSCTTPNDNVPVYQVHIV